MPQITIALDNRNLEQGLTRLALNAPRAIARALNRSIASARTAVASPIAKDMGLKVGDVRDALKIREAVPSDGRMVATLYASKTRIPLIDFGATGPEPSRGKGRGISSRMRGGARRYPHAFFATVGNGHRGIFERKTKARLPIRELRGPSIVHVFAKYAAVGLARGQEQLVKNLQSELRFAIRRPAA